MSEPVGQRIQQAREAMGLSLRALAERMSMDHRRLHRIETGQQEAKESDLRAFSEAFGVSVGELFGESPSEAA